ncbi:MAG: tRNA pseudouridine(55) synthase TruB [Candidatus Kapaibacterium sp.]
MKILNKNTITEFSSWRESADVDGGVMLIDKQTDWTSSDVVVKLRNTLRVKKIGHAGTLDPLATGLLVLCVGKATKSINTFQDQPKEYVAIIRLGATTKTDDAEGEEEHVVDVSTLPLDAITNALPQYTGEIQQIPPMYSALKVGGKKLYELARKDKEIERAPRTVTIYSIELVSVALPYCTVRVTCSKGTYIRTLARDIGNTLGVGGYLKELRRTKIGEFSVDDALTISDVKQAVEQHTSTN